jgi:hypothetical protein
MFFLDVFVFAFFHDVQPTLKMDVDKSNNSSSENQARQNE